MNNISIGAEEIEHRFGFHKATIEGANATLPMHRDVRILFKDFAAELDRILPPGRAKSLTFTHLEDASMWSHKAIAETAPVVHEEKPMSDLDQDMADESLTGIQRLRSLSEDN